MTTWSLVSGAVWGGLGDVALLEEMKQQGAGFEVSKPHATPGLLSMLPACNQRAAPVAPTATY